MSTELAATIDAGQQDQLPGYLGIKLVSASPDEVVGELTVEKHLCTAGDILHGGTIMAFADNLGAVGAFLNLEPGTGTTTVESKTNFLRPAPIGEKVTATSRLINKGRTLMLWQTELRDTRDRLLAVVTQSQIILAPK